MSKLYNFCYGYDVVYTTLLKTLQTQVQFENSRVVFQCKQTKTETFENDGVAAHIRSVYP